MNRGEVIRKAIFKPLVLLYLAAPGVTPFFSFTSFHLRLHSKISKANQYMTLFKEKGMQPFCQWCSSDVGHGAGRWDSWTFDLSRGCAATATACKIHAGVPFPAMSVGRQQPLHYLQPHTFETSPCAFIYLPAWEEDAFIFCIYYFTKGNTTEEKTNIWFVSEECYQPVHLLVNLFWEVNCKETLYKC